MGTPEDIRRLLEKSGQMRVALSRTHESSPYPIIFQFWDRLVENNRAILVLLDNELFNEAAAVQRISIEHLSTMIGLLKGHVTEQQLHDEAVNQTVKLANNIDSEEKKDSVLTEENKARLAEVRRKVGKIETSKLGVADLLQKCRLSFLYYRYRTLSNTAVHSTLLSAIDPFSKSDVPELLKTAQELLQFAMEFMKEGAASVAG
ncbi:DUF5677 domain-containing protein [Achromobacter xylosoxidans]|uniref:DUF5677 domain-containing protein n=1 Tax=Alcaligenes xylosoxydans xylosoxydans TaxID=85698 RepID=UPI001EEAF685|nr:DUF5677 domain-containing protein [Achromobacter xylosoxidans]